MEPCSEAGTGDGITTVEERGTDFKTALAMERKTARAFVEEDG